MIVSIPVMAVYDADVETKMMESSISNIGGFSCMSLECYSFKTLIGIYESNEHHNKLIAEQNKLLEERNKIAWVELCYAPHSGYVGTWGNPDKLSNECLVNGYDRR